MTPSTTSKELSERLQESRGWEIHRDGRGWPRWYQRFLEAWWIITGEWSLHRAWERGKTYGSHSEYERIIKNMGEIASQRENVKLADSNIALLTNGLLQADAITSTTK